MFGLAIVPLIGFAGVAMDYARAVSVKTKLNSILDASILVAASKRGDLTAAQAQTEATKFFNAQATAAGITSTASFTVTDNASGRSAVGTFTSEVKTFLTSVIGFKKLPPSLEGQQPIIPCPIWTPMCSSITHPVDGHRRDHRRHR